MKTPWTKALLLLCVVSVAGCRDVTLPSPASAGTIQATVLFAEPGRAALQPAVGATVELLRTSLNVKVTETTGHVLLTPITTDTGVLLFRFDANRDGAAEYQRVVRLEDIGARPGRDIVLGNLVLGGNATVRGSVVGSDRATQPQGHGGTTVFVPEGPYIVYSGDNGGFTLDGLPEGRLTLTFFREGYAPANLNVTLQSNQRLDLNPVVLERLPGAAPTSTAVTGLVSLVGASDSSGVSVSTNGVAVAVVTDAAGRYTFPSVTPGLHTFGFTKTGFQTAVLNNVLVEGTTFEMPTVSLVPGTSVTPQLDAGLPPFDAGIIDAGSVDAGASVDAGPVDSGSPDAGAPDAGNVDSGVPDAGNFVDAGVDAGALDSGTRDAGSFDAGPVDAGALDAGTVLDAGVDAGQPPVAVVDATLPFYSTNAVVTVVGQNSLGTRPFTYRWAQDGGATFTTTNNSPAAATIGVRLPSTPSVTRLSLTVIDGLGVSSAPTEFSLVALSGAPVATISPTPPATVYAGQRITLGSVGSNDPSNTGIVAYEWAVTPSNAGIVGTPLDGGASFDLQMPSTVTVNTPVSVSLTVLNGFGVRSMAAGASFTLSTASAPTWTLDAGQLLVVPGGSTVRLTGLATPPSPGPTFSYAWSPLGITDAGVPELNWQLTTPNSASTQFVAPLISGAPQTLTFTVTATNTNGGLTPAQRSTQLLVQVVDQRVPQVAGTSISMMTGSPFGAYVDYDEDLQLPVSSPPFVGTLSEPVQLYGSRRLRMGFSSLVQEATNLVLQTGQPTDQAGNRVTPSNLSYLAHYLWPAPGAAQASTSEPLPTVVIEPTGALGEAQATLLGRKDSAAAIHQAVALPTCLPSGCTVSVDSAAPSIAMSPTGTRVGPSVLTASGVTYVLLQVADYTGNSGVAVARKPSGWAAIASPPGTLFSDGTTLYSAYADSGTLAFSTYDPMADAWVSPTVVATNAVDYASGTTSQARVWGRMSSTGITWIVARTATGDLRTFLRLTPSSAWTGTTFGNPSAQGNAFRDLKFVFAKDSDAFNYLMVRRGNGIVSINVIATGTSGGNTDLTNVSAFDAYLGLGDVWVATIESGHLTVRYNRQVWTALIGQSRGGPVTSLNNDVTCTADAPVLQRWGEHMVVAWQERCGAGPWVAYLRWLR